MDLADKLAILADSAKYDASCASSGSARAGTIGAARPAGVCHSWAADGRCVSLLKVLFSNHCIYDCAYCVSRRSNDVRRCTFTVQELVDLTINFYKRNYIEGLFLSSGILGDPDYTMDRLIAVARRLRRDEGFGGYIHLKAIPGASERCVNEAGLYADRISVNIELPSEQSLTALAPQKTKRAIVGTMGRLADKLRETQEDHRRLSRTPTFAPAGQSTQLIVGASPESDRTIVTLASHLYNRLAMRRVYYSAYMPVGSDRRLPSADSPPLQREHRLYQADWLIRLYHYDVAELFTEGQEEMDSEVDPKLAWALRNYDLFPVDVQRADYRLLLRVPGIGPQGARRIVHTRRRTRLTFDLLKRFGIALNRARYFITCNGLRIEACDLPPDHLRALFAGKTTNEAPPTADGTGGRSVAAWGQLSIFPNEPSDTAVPPDQRERRSPNRPTGNRTVARTANQRARPARPAAHASLPSLAGVKKNEIGTVPPTKRYRLLYDGTFAGLLTLFDAVVERVDRIPEEIVATNRHSDHQNDLFIEDRLIETDSAGAVRAARRLGRNRSLFALMYHAFLSELPGIERSLVVLARGSIDRGQLDAPAFDEAVLRAEEGRRRLLHEAERFLGILRFVKRGDDLWVAEMEPDCRLLPVIAPSFVERMHTGRWYIIDRKRHELAFYDGTHLHFGSADEGAPFDTTAESDTRGDETMQNLWRDYVRHIAIEDRTNLALQQHFLPKKYRRYLTELNANG